MFVVKYLKLRYLVDQFRLAVDDNEGWWQIRIQVIENEVLQKLSLARSRAADDMEVTEPSLVVKFQGDRRQMKIMEGGLLHDRLDGLLWRPFHSEIGVSIFLVSVPGTIL